MKIKNKEQYKAKQHKKGFPVSIVVSLKDYIDRKEIRKQKKEQQ
jgi:hypothetical protein